MKLFKERLLTDSQLKRLGEHKYSCQSVSICDALLQPYWNWLCSKTPIWLAPNLITSLGLIINVITALILVWYSPDGKQPCPRWACALCALGLFLYQSLDAIDGKQARRTGTANPLGELFDHGCDSISTVFVAISACTAIQLGYHPEWMFFQCFCAMTLFYCAHWQTYVSGTLRFGRVDVTEAQLTIISILTISAIFGTDIWAAKVFGMNFELANTLCIVFYLGYLAVFRDFKDNMKKGGKGKNGSTVAGTSVLSPILPLLSVLIPAFVIQKKSKTFIYQNHPALYILTFGLVSAKVTNRLVVAHMTKSELAISDSVLMGPLMLFLNQYFDCFIDEYVILWLALGWVALDLTIYCTRICLEICKFLRVELFRIPYPGGPVRIEASSPQETNGNKAQSKVKPRSKSKHF